MVSFCQAKEHVQYWSNPCLKTCRQTNKWKNCITCLMCKTLITTATFYHCDAAFYCIMCFHLWYWSLVRFVNEILDCTLYFLCFGRTLMFSVHTICKVTTYSPSRITFRPTHHPFLPLSAYYKAQYPRLFPQHCLTLVHCA